MWKSLSSLIWPTTRPYVCVSTPSLPSWVEKRRSSTYLLQQVIRDLSPNRLTKRVEHDFEVFPLIHSATSDNLICKRKPKLTCRLELSFLKVFAQPKLSNKGLVARTISLMPSIPPDPGSAALTAAMYCMILLAASVFPAPDSPDMMTH